MSRCTRDSLEIADRGRITGHGYFSNVLASLTACALIQIWERTTIFAFVAVVRDLPLASSDDRLTRLTQEAAAAAAHRYVFDVDRFSG